MIPSVKLCGPGQGRLRRRMPTVRSLREEVRQRLVHQDLNEHKDARAGQLEHEHAARLTRSGLCSCRA